LTLRLSVAPLSLNIETGGEPHLFDIN